MNKGLLLEIPYGTRDFLPKDAKVKREIESKLAKNFSLWGYDEIVTPTIEYVDTLTINNRSGIETHLFKFFDKNNKTSPKIDEVLFKFWINVVYMPQMHYWFI